jgi:transposase
MKTQLPLNASEEELALIKKLVDSGKLKSKFAIRLLVILNRTGGKTLVSIAEFLNISLSSVIRYIERFNTEGLASLLKDKTRKPGKIPISVEKKNEVCKIACSEKPKNATHWSVRSLAKRVGISKSSVNAILRERGIKPHLVETFQFSADELFAEKLRDVVGLYMNPPDNAIIGLVQQPIPMNPIRFGLLNKSRKMRSILLFLSGICSITEVIEQVYSLCRREIPNTGVGENTAIITLTGEYSRSSNR